MMLTPGRVLAGRIFFAVGGVGFLLGLLPSTLAGRLDATRLALVITAGAFIVAWVWFWLRALGSEGPAAAIGVGALTVLASLLTLLSPFPGDAVVFASLVAGVGLATRSGVAAVVAIAILSGLIQVVLHTPRDGAFLRFLNALFVGLVAVGGRLLAIRSASSGTRERRSPASR